MKSNQRSHYLIVFVVILCSLTLLAALTFALYGFQWQKGGRTLEIEFRASTGIKLHSSVRFAGAPAGTVTRIRYLTLEERKKSKDPRNVIRVTVRLNEDVPPISADIGAELASETILGEKFILLTPGEATAAALPDGAVVQGQEVIAFDSVARSAQSAITRVDEILASLQKDYPNLIPKLSELLAQGGSLLGQGSNFIANAGGAVTNASDVVAQFKTDYTGLMAQVSSLLNQVKSIATNADLAVQQTGSFVTHADTLLKNNEADLHQMLAELRVVAQNLKVVSTYAKALTGALGEKPSRLIWRAKKTTLPTEQEILESAEPLPVELPKK